jgi:hypothetical protein
MMQAWRTLLLICVGLGATWAAGFVTGRGPLAMSAAAADEAPAIAEVTQAEVDAEIAAAEKAIAEAGKGGTPRSRGAEVAGKPLSADLAVALPSDI